MITRIPALYGTTLYQASASVNTGADEILELVKEGERKGERELYTVAPSRVLIKFPTDTLRDFAGDESNSFNLKLYATQEAYLPTSATFTVFPVSESWDQGTGRRFNVPVSTNGANWKTTNGENAWLVTESGGRYFADFSSASYVGNEVGGGNWYYIESSSFELQTTSSDTECDVTEIVDKWISGTYYPNNGFLIKFSGSTEHDSVNYGQFKFFSPLTNTIFAPVIEIRREDWQFTGDLVEAEYDCRIELNSRYEGYGVDEIARLQVIVKDVYTVPSFTTGTNLRVLPENSWYEIRDLYSDAVVIPAHQTYTKLSRNKYGNYFDLPLTGISPNRRYVVKIFSNFNGAVKHFSGQTFKVI